MTLLSGLLAIVAVGMMATLALLAVLRDRDLRRNAPASVAPRPPQATTLGARGDGGQVPPPAVR
ncbi:hypothetical protein ACN3XK_11495 [Actinomadura welshii]